MYKFRYLHNLTENTFQSGAIIGIGKKDKTHTCEIKYEEKNRTNSGVNFESFNISVKKCQPVQLPKNHENFMRDKVKFCARNEIHLSVSEFEKLLTKLDDEFEFNFPKSETTVIHREYTEQTIKNVTKPVFSRLTYNQNPDGTYNVNYTYETYHYLWTDGMTSKMSDYTEENISKKELDKWVEIANGKN